MLVKNLFSEKLWKGYKQINEKEGIGKMTYYKYLVRYGNEDFENVIIDQRVAKKAISNNHKWLRGFKKDPAGGFNVFQINMSNVLALEELNKISKQEYQELTGEKEE